MFLLIFTDFVIFYYMFQVYFDKMCAVPRIQDFFVLDVYCEFMWIKDMREYFHKDVKLH